MSRWRHLFAVTIPALGLAAAEVPTPTPTPLSFSGGIEALPSKELETSAKGKGLSSDVAGFRPDGVEHEDAPATSPQSAVTVWEAPNSAPLRARPSDFTPVAAPVSSSRVAASASSASESAEAAPAAPVAVAAASAPVSYYLNEPTVAPLSVPEPSAALISASARCGVVLSPGGAGSIGVLSYDGKLELNGGDSLIFDFRASKDGRSLLTDKVTANVLDIDSTQNSPFLISLNTYNAKGQRSSLDFTLFDPTKNFTWTLIDANKITGFDPKRFVVDTTGFLSDTKGGTFIVGRNGDDLVLNFTPVPEPSTWALLGTGAFSVVMFSLRRRRRS